MATQITRCRGSAESETQKQAEFWNQAHVLGYLIVALCKNGKRNTHKFHKLVSREWVENPDEKRCVDHCRKFKNAENGRNQEQQQAQQAQYTNVFIGTRKQHNGLHICMIVEPKNLGLFQVEKEAAFAHSFAAVERYGEFARLNEIED